MNMPRFVVSFIRVSLILLFCSSVFPPLAQEALLGGAKPAADTPALTSPQAVVATFYDAMTAIENGKKDALDTALVCLYLDDLPADSRAEQGQVFAEKLYALMNEFVFKLEDIPAELEGNDYTFTLNDAERSLDLALHRYEDGAWRFSYSKTLAQLDDIAAVFNEAHGEEAAKEWAKQFNSPRDTLQAFIRGVNSWRDGGMDTAIAALDLSEIADDEVREERGWTLATQLMKVLNRVKYIRLNEVPNNPDTEPFTVFEHPVGNITIAPDQDEESGVWAWKFSADTVEHIPGLYDLYHWQPVVDGVVENVPALSSLWLRDFVAENAPFLLKDTLILENWQWLGLFVIILAGMGISRLIAHFTLVLVKNWFKRDEKSLDQKLEKGFVRPIRVALMAWVWLLGLAFLQLPPQTLYYLRIGAKTVSAAAAVWACYRLVDIVGDFLAQRAARTRSKYDDLLVPLVVRSLKVLVAVFGIVFVAEVLDLDYKGLLAGLGIGGLAVALAAKDTVGNLFGSITVLADRPFNIGDWVKIGEVEGSVESVGMRSTRIRTFYDSVISMPNSNLTSAVVDNMGVRRYRRYVTNISLTYDTSPEEIEAFCEGIRELIRRHPYTRKDYYHVYFNDMAASALQILVYVFWEAPDWGTELRERHRLLIDIMRLAERLGVEFAFPTQTLYVRPEDMQERPGTPVSNSHASEVGRREAARLTKDTFREDKPEPVTFDIPTYELDDLGDEDASGETRGKEKPSDT